jgi:membrane-associated protein
MDFIIYLLTDTQDALSSFVQAHGSLIYLLLFFIVFIETGIVVFPFLPGDSLLFASGVIASYTGNVLNAYVVIFTCILAATLGNLTNYGLGRIFGPQVLEKEKLPLIKKEHIHDAHEFYERWGALAIVIGRFMPFIRTFVPFVAGIASMNFNKYLIYTILGASLWVAPFVMVGKIFGQNEIVQNNFKLIVLLVLIISVIPSVLGVVTKMMKKKNNTAN